MDDAQQEVPVTLFSGKGKSLAETGPVVRVDGLCRFTGKLEGDDLRDNGIPASPVDEPEACLHPVFVESEVRYRLDLQGIRIQNVDRFPEESPVVPVPHIPGVCPQGVAPLRKLLFQIEVTAIYAGAVVADLNPFDQFIKGVEQFQIDISTHKYRLVVQRIHQVAPQPDPFPRQVVSLVRLHVYLLMRKIGQLFREPTCLRT